MLVFCHLFIGAVLGLIIYRWVGKRWVVPVAALGAILPDIVDKPLGHLFLQSTLDSGRIYAHTLLFIGLIAAGALVAWKARSSVALAALAVGVASHLALDSMWDIPNTLFWPLLGPFEPHHFPDYFAASIAVEIASPLEWMFGIMVLSIMVTLYRGSLGALGEKAARALEPLQLPVLALLLVAGAVTLGAGALTAWVDPVDGQTQIIAGASAVLGGAYLMRLELRRSAAALSST